MARAPEAAALALALLLLPAAAAHGPLPERLDDPLLRPLAAWPQPDGALGFRPPDAAHAPFPGPAPGEAPALAWSLAVPRDAGLLGGFHARLAFRAEGLVVPRAPDQALLEVRTLRAGEEVGLAVVPAPEAPMQPGMAYVLEARAGQQPFSASAGDALVLEVRLVGAAAGGAAALLLGPDTRANLTAQFAGLDALGHEHAGWRHLGLDALAAERAVHPGALELDLHHGDPEAATRSAPAFAPLRLRVVNAETPTQGAAHGPWGTDAPHAVRMRGLGLDSTFLVYPSEVLVRDLGPAEPGELTFACASGCAREAVFATLQVAAPGASRGESLRLQPGQAHEVNLRLAQGEALRWGFEASQPLAWDLHSHAGNEVVVHARGQDRVANGTFAAPAEGTYSLLFRNDNPQPLDVRYTIHGGQAAEEPPKALPGAPWAAAAAVAGLTALGRRRRGKGDPGPP